MAAAKRLWSFVLRHSKEGAMFTVISYDVVVDKQRTKVLKYLKGYGTHVQYSVFECDLTARQLVVVKRELSTLIDRTTDSVRVYQFDADAVKRVEVIGIGRVSIDPLYYLVGGG
jgi:CRISPR-associated protein Cas2